jgi:hypothetical protein
LCFFVIDFFWVDTVGNLQMQESINC